MKQMLIGILLILACSSSFAKTLNVGFVSNPVYATLKNSDHPGIALELWEIIAKENHWHYKLINVGKDTNAAIKKLADGQYDVIIGGISVTKPRLEQVQFTLPFFISSTGLITANNEVTLVQHLVKLFSHLLNVKLLFILLFVFLLLNIFWLIARSVNQAPKSYFVGLATSFWICICLVLPGSLEFDSKYLRLRIISVIILLLSMFSLSILVATIVSSFTTTLMKSNQKVLKLSDIGFNTVVAVKGSSYADMARHKGLRVKIVKTYQQAINTLFDKKTIGFVTGVSGATYYLKTHPDAKLQISPFRFRYSQLTFAVPKDSPYLNKINTSLLSLQEDGSAAIICAKYLRPLDAKLCSL